MNTNTDTVACACGCGGMHVPFDARGRPRKFIRGHWSRLQPDTRIDVPCENCGKATKRARWQRERKLRVFCSHVCAGLFATKSGIRRGENNGYYNTIEAPCEGCGSPVRKAKSLIVRRNGRVYCPACLHHVRKGRRGFYVGYPPEFSASLRASIRRRDGNECQLCHITREFTTTLHVHHIDYDKANNSPSNLIALCRSCHGQTNFGTDSWQAMFQALMRERGYPDLRYCA